MGVCCCNSNRQAAFVMGIIFVVLNIVGVILGKNSAQYIGISKFLLKTLGGCGTSFMGFESNWNFSYIEPP